MEEPDLKPGYLILEFMFLNHNTLPASLAGVKEIFAEWMGWVDVR